MKNRAMIPRRHRVVPAVTTAVAVVLSLAIARTAAGESGRSLGGYRFIPVSNVEEPFVTTRFDNFTGLAWASGLEFPLLVIDTDPPDTLLSLGGNFLFVLARFDYRHAVHPRISLVISGSGASRVGTSASALLSQGVTVLTTGRLGAVVEMWRYDRAVVSAALGTTYSDGLIIDFVQFVEDVIDGDYQNAAIVKDASGFSVDGSLRGAWAVNRWAGILAAAGIGYSDVKGLSENLRWRAAVSGTVDFGQRGNAPLGLSLSLDADRLRPQPIQSEYALGIGIGIYYTGREDLNLGLELKGSRLPLENWDKTAYPLSFGATLSYYF